MAAAVRDHVAADYFPATDLHSQCYAAAASFMERNVDDYNLVRLRASAKQNGGGWGLGGGERHLPIEFVVRAAVTAVSVAAAAALCACAYGWPDYATDFGWGSVDRMAVAFVVTESTNKNGHIFKPSRVKW